MADYALVIGCDRYWDEPSALHGAVRDALAVRKWLLDRVPPQNLTLLLSAHDGTAVPARAGPATRAGIVQAVDDLLLRSDGDEGTLYFYFAGHGLTARADRFDEPCLLPADFTPRYRDPALPIRDLREQFASSTLTRQFLIVDACRGVPAGRDFKASGLSDIRPRDYTRPEPNQYVRLATSAGQVAYETGPHGMAKGEFTAALLRGLSGAGAAKLWDARQGRYVVRLDQLFGYVRAELKRAGVEQLPRSHDKDDEPNPVLAEFPADAFDPVQLTVTLSPPAAADHAIIWAFGPEDRMTRPPIPDPLLLRLAPRTYSVRARAPGFVARRPEWSVDLYDDTALTVELEPATDKSIDLPDFLEVAPGQAIDRISRPDEVEVGAPDGSAVVERTDEAGQVEFAAGHTVVDRVTRYRLRVVEPHGAGPVTRGDAPRPAPAESPIAAALARDAGFVTGPDGWLTPGPRSSLYSADGRVGGSGDPVVIIAPPTAAAVAAMAVSAALDPAAARPLGLPRLIGNLIVAVVGDLPDEIVAGRKPLRRCHDHLAVAALPRSAGPQVIDLHGLADRPLHIATFVPPDGPALVVVDAAGPAVLTYPVARDAGPLTARAVIRADRAQRFAAAGRLAEAHAALRSGPAGHVGDILTGLLAARRGAAGAAEVARAATVLRARGPQLPDLAVLDALASTAGRPQRGRSRPAPPAFTGVPLLAASLTAAAALHRDADQALPEPLAEAVAGLLPDQPGSAWFSTPAGPG